jgi:hypothetical protein
MAAVERALAANNIDAAMQAIPWDKLEKLNGAIAPILRDVLEKSGALAAATVTAVLPKGVTMAFDVTNPRAVAWVRAHAAELVTKNIVQSGREAIRQVMVRAFEKGLPPKQAAEYIKQYIGLLPKQATAVDNYRTWLLEEKGYIKVDADRLAKQYAQILVKQRATVIARNETMKASNEGQRELWRQAAEAGTLRAEEWQREWIVTPDPDRLCELCEPMAGKHAPFPDGAYENGSDGPPLHVQCLCVEGLVRVKE